MSDAPKQYAQVIGVVQSFMKDGVRQPATRTADFNGSIVTNFTVKGTSGSLVDIALWENDFPGLGAKIAEGFLVWADGEIKSRESNGKTYYTITPYRFGAVPSVSRAPREVVNPTAAPAPVAAAPVAPAPVAAAPVAAAPVAQAAPAAAPDTFNF